MKLRLKDILVIVLCCSAMNILDGELFFLSVFRGDNISQWLESFREKASILRFEEIISPVGLLSDQLVNLIYQVLHEHGVFLFYVLALVASSLSYLKLLDKLTSNSVLSVLLAGIGILGVTTGTKDFSISLSFFLSAVEIILLTSIIRRRVTAGIAVCLIHLTIDSSFILAPVFVLLRSELKFLHARDTTSRIRERLLLASLIFVGCIFSVGKDEVSAYASFIPFLAAGLAVILSVTAKSQKILFFTFAVFTLGGFSLWELVTNQRFPAFAFYSPLIAAVIWELSEGRTKEHFKESFKRLEGGLFSFLTPANKLASFWLLLSFIFFQLATKVRHPVNEAYLPSEVMDFYSESNPPSPPLHPLEIGGYVAYRLQPVLRRTEQLNFLDLSSYLNFSLQKRREFKKIWSDKNSGLFESLSPTAVLCRGKDQLCAVLKANAQWRVTSHSTVAEKIMAKLNQLPADKKAIVMERLERESWYLLQRIVD